MSHEPIIDGTYQQGLFQGDGHDDEVSLRLFGQGKVGWHVVDLVWAECSETVVQSDVVGVTLADVEVFDQTPRLQG